MPASRTIISRVFDEHLQEDFAALSGDRNPMHMDPVAARRTQAGVPVVHGVHALLWSLESLLATGTIASKVVQIKVRFLKWIYIGDEASLVLPLGEQLDPKKLEVHVRGLQVLTADLIYGEPQVEALSGSLAPSPEEPHKTALDLSFADLANRVGDAFVAPNENAPARFPLLSSSITPTAVAEIAACSYIVGMEAPGLHSMFSKLAITIRKCEQGNEGRTALHYAVTYIDERFRKVQISVSGRCVSGILDTFVRVAPVEQPAMSTVAMYVNPLEFEEMRALIIGGSRGLGELTAKLVAAGGGSVTITYALGKVDAERLTNHIEDCGGRASVIPYDVRKKPLDQLESISELPTHLFYFATNTIYRPKKGVLSGSILAEFVEFYVQGFYDLCNTLTELRARGGTPQRKLIAFYPSTVFIDERPAAMTEYAMVKAAGEQLCADMNIYLPDLQVIVHRLPKLLTDQTAGVLPERSTDAIGALLPIIRQVMDLSLGQG